MIAERQLRAVEQTMRLENQSVEDPTAARGFAPVSSWTSFCVVPARLWDEKMTDVFHADENATPLTKAERADLIPTHISLRSELNELEQKNVATSVCCGPSGAKDSLSTEAFLKGFAPQNVLMPFGGGPVTTRTSDRNFGVNLILSNPNSIKSSMISATRSNTRATHHDELAIRFKYRAVTVHPFQTEMAAGRVWRETC